MFACLIVPYFQSSNSSQLRITQTKIRPRSPVTYGYTVYPISEHQINVQTANAALVTVLRTIGYQGHEPTDLVPHEDWTVIVLDVVFNIHNFLNLAPLHFQNVEEAVRAMRDFYHRSLVPYEIDVDISFGSLLMGKATLRLDANLSTIGGSSVQVARRLL